MESTSFVTRLVLVVLLVVVVVVGWIVLIKLPGCCPSEVPAHTHSEVPEHSHGDRPPGKGSEIIVTPTGASPTAEWTIDGTGLDASNAGTAGYLRDDLFGEIHTFQAQSDSATVLLRKMTLALNGGHTVVVERTATNQFAWTLDGNPLVACDAKGTSDVDDCRGLGVPIEFEGTITTLEVVRADGATLPGSSVKQIRITAQK